VYFSGQVPSAQAKIPYVDIPSHCVQWGYIFQGLQKSDFIHIPGVQDQINPIENIYHLRWQFRQPVGEMGV